MFVGPLAWTVPPQQTSALQALLPPGPGHPLGTDELGRDELSRLLHGGQVTLLVGFAAMLTATLLGLLVGATAGFYSGWTDAVLMRLTDTMTAPAFFLIVTAVVVLGPGPITLILVIGGTSWMQVARVIYGETLRFKGAGFRAGRGSDRRPRAAGSVPPRPAADHSVGGRFGHARRRRLPS